MRAILDFLLPTRCANCSRLGSPVCASCELGFTFELHDFIRDEVSGVAASNYGSTEQSLIHQFKEKGQTSLAPYLAKPLIDPLRQMLGRCSANFQGSKPWLVTIPSSRSNYLKRGFMPAAILANRLNALSGRPCLRFDGLKMLRQTADQARLSSQSREENLRGSMIGHPQMSGQQVILFDDVVTTGATLKEGSRALKEVGAEILGCLVFSETILKTQTKT